MEDEGNTNWPQGKSGLRQKCVLHLPHIVIHHFSYRLLCRHLALPEFPHKVDNWHCQSSLLLAIFINILTTSLLSYLPSYDPPCSRFLVFSVLEISICRWFWQSQGLHSIYDGVCQSLPSAFSDWYTHWFHTCSRRRLWFDILFGQNILKKFLKHFF